MPTYSIGTLQGGSDVTLDPRFYSDVSFVLDNGNITVTVSSTGIVDGGEINIQFNLATATPRTISWSGLRFNGTAAQPVVGQQTRIGFVYRFGDFTETYRTTF